MFTPIIATDKLTGRKVHCTIFEAHLFETGFFSFKDLWEMHKGDLTVQIMNGLHKTEVDSATGRTIVYADAEL